MSEVLAEKVTLSYEPFEESEGGDFNLRGTLVRIHAASDATREDFNEALKAYPDTVDSAFEVFTRLRTDEVQERLTREERE